MTSTQNTGVWTFDMYYYIDDMMDLYNMPYEDRPSNYMSELLEELVALKKPKRILERLALATSSKNGLHKDDVLLPLLMVDQIMHSSLTELPVFYSSIYTLLAMHGPSIIPPVFKSNLPLFRIIPGDDILDVEHDYFKFQVSCLFSLRSGGMHAEAAALSPTYRPPLHFLEHDDNESAHFSTQQDICSFETRWRSLVHSLTYGV